jgi:hypothetical protein
MLADDAGLLGVARWAVGGERRKNAVGKCPTAPQLSVGYRLPTSDAIPVSP